VGVARAVVSTHWARRLQICGNCNRRARFTGTWQETSLFGLNESLIAPSTPAAFAQSRTVAPKLLLLVRVMAL